MKEVEIKVNMEKAIHSAEETIKVLQKFSQTLDRTIRQLTEEGERIQETKGDPIEIDQIPEKGKLKSLHGRLKRNQIPVVYDPFSTYGDLEDYAIHHSVRDCGRHGFAISVNYRFTGVHHFRKKNWVA